MKNRSPFNARRHHGGFSLLEVLIAMVVLAFGLLGFALLQTMNVRYVQSSNYRTQATNLAYDLTEQMRSNRYQAAWYSTATFSAGSRSAAGICARPVAAVTIAQNVAAWQCKVVKALGDNAAATVTVNNGVATVAITWADERWNAKSPDTPTTFALQTQL